MCPSSVSTGWEAEANPYQCDTDSPVIQYTGSTVTGVKERVVFHLPIYGIHEVLKDEVHGRIGAFSTEGKAVNRI
jgi:hypothetical protein